MQGCIVRPRRLFPPLLRSPVLPAALLMLSLAAGCAPSPEANVLGYLLAERLGTLSPGATTAPPGSMAGVVQHGGAPLAGATVVVAERNGTPHTAVSDAAGRYRIDGIPPGQYVPAAVAPGYEETVPRGWFGIPQLVTITSTGVSAAPPLELEPHIAQPLPEPLAAGVALSVTAVYSAATNFPPGTQADITAFQFTYNGATVDSLRLYLPRGLPPDARLPLLLMVYPTTADNWWPVSVGFASQGYALVALSPIAARGVDIDGHAQDARVAFHLAQSGSLSPHIAPGKAVALGGSFSSPILHRFLRDERDRIAGWVTVGGISNAFAGAADYYAGLLEMPPAYEYAVPALGPPNLYPLALLRYSPVYTAASLPPTMIIHTAADRIARIEQAYQLETALRAAGVPVEVFYYQDVSHYLQIGDDLTEAGAEMFYRILDFARRVQAAE